MAFLYILGKKPNISTVFPCWLLSFMGFCDLNIPYFYVYSALSRKIIMFYYRVLCCLTFITKVWGLKLYYKWDIQFNKVQINVEKIPICKKAIEDR